MRRTTSLNVPSCWLTSVSYVCNVKIRTALANAYEFFLIFAIANIKCGLDKMEHFGTKLIWVF